MNKRETTEKKPTCKNAGVSPTALHETPYKTCWGYVSIDGELTFTKVYKSKNKQSNDQPEYEECLSCQ